MVNDVISVAAAMRVVVGKGLESGFAICLEASLLERLLPPRISTLDCKSKHTNRITNMQQTRCKCIDNIGKLQTYNSENKYVSNFVSLQSYKLQHNAPLFVWLASLLLCRKYWLDSHGPKTCFAGTKKSFKINKNHPKFKKRKVTKSFKSIKTP